jgi:hypothetical protein
MSKRCAKLVADVAEKLGRQNIQFRQLLPLPRNFSLVGFLFGNIAALSRDEHHFADFVFDRHQGGVDYDRLLTPSAAEDFGVPADELASSGARDPCL